MNRALDFIAAICAMAVLYAWAHAAAHIIDTFFLRAGI